METGPKVRLEDLERDYHRHLEQVAPGRRAGMRGRLAGHGLSEQLAMLSPRGQAAMGPAGAGGAGAPGGAEAMGGAGARETPAVPAPGGASSLQEPALEGEPRQGPPASGAAGPQGTGGPAAGAPAPEAPSQGGTTPGAPIPGIPGPGTTPGAPIPGTPAPEGPSPEPPQASPQGPVPEPGAPVPAPPASLTGGARPLLRQGASGPPVVELQSLLNQRDEVTQHLAVDGLFGPITAAAVRQFQAAHPPLAVDAVVGPLTWGMLDGTSLEPQDPKELAKKLFRRSADAFNRKEYAHAYDLATSAQEHFYDPALVFNRAQCLRYLGGRADEAVALYEQYIAAGGPRSAEAAAHVADLKGPARTGVREVDVVPAKAAFQKSCQLYNAGDYGHAYDELKKADRLVHDPALVFNMAQCLRLLGGRADEAVALYEQYIGEGGPRSAEAAAHVAELRGPARTGVREVDVVPAKEAFRKSCQLYNAGDYGHAYDELKKADRLVHDPALTFSMAQCLRQLGARRGEAIALYEQYLAEGGTRADEARFYAQELRNQGALSEEQRV